MIMMAMGLFILSVIIMLLLSINIFLGEMFMIFFLIYMSLNTVFFMALLLKQGKGSGVSETSLLSWVLCTMELMGNLGFVLSFCLLKDNDLLIGYVFVKFGVIPFMMYLYIKDTEGEGDLVWKSFMVMSYMSLSKIGGLVMFMVISMEPMSVISYSWMSIIFLMMVKGGSVSEFMFSVIVLDGVFTMSLLLGGMGYYNVLGYIFMSYILQLGAMSVMLGSKSLVSFYCLASLAGGPLHPLAVFKYLGIVSILYMDMFLFFLLIMVSMKYFIIFLFYMSNEFKDTHGFEVCVAIYTLVCMMVLVFLLKVVMGVVEGEDVLLEEMSSEDPINGSSYPCCWYTLSFYDKYVDSVVVSYQDPSYAYDLVTYIPVEIKMTPPMKAHVMEFSFVYSFPKGKSLSYGSFLYYDLSAPKPKMVWIK